MDPELWDHVSRAVETEDSVPSETLGKDDSALADQSAQEEPTGDELFTDEGEFNDDSWMEPGQLFSQILNPSLAVGDGTTEISGPGVADEDEIDLTTVHIPEIEEMGRGKRRRISNKWFDGFLGH